LLHDERIAQDEPNHSGLSRSVASLYGAVVQFMKSIKPSCPTFANYAFEIWKRRRSGCPFRERNHVRMAYRGSIAANILSNDRDEIRLNRSTSSVAIIPNAFLAGLDERAILGPILLEGGVALQSALQHGSYTVLGFGPPGAVPNEVKASRSRSNGGNETSLTRFFAATRARRSKEPIRRARASTKPSSRRPE